MSDILAAIDPDGDVEYFWPPLEPNLLPGDGIKQLAKKYEAHGPYEFYIAVVWGRQGEHEWPTKSWLEVAYSSAGRVGLVLWESGVPEDKDLEIPKQANAGWNECDGPDDALARLQAKLKLDEKMPIIGVTELFDGVTWQPFILGYEGISG